MLYILHSILLFNELSDEEGELKEADGLQRSISIDESTVELPVAHILVSDYNLNAQITTKVVCFSRLLKCLRSIYGKQCGPRSDCRSSLFWVHTVLLRQ